MGTGCPGGAAVTAFKDVRETSGTTQCRGLFSNAVFDPQLELDYLRSLFQPNRFRDL